MWAVLCWTYTGDNVAEVKLLGPFPTLEHAELVARTDDEYDFNEVVSL